MQEPDLYFSQYFDVDPGAPEAYGAFDISVVSDLPLFVDPFLLFNSDDPTYQQLHQQILDYLLFLRDRAAETDLDPQLIDAWYRFKEVKQNWLGFTLFGNGGAGLGKDFAHSLHGALADIFRDFGKETVTRGTHLEKLCLIRPGVGKDNISDFTTNLIKGFLCEYTQTFAQQHIDPKHCQEFAVLRTRFDYGTRTWVTERYYLPRLFDDFVLLTPADILTRDETWINYGDMVSKFRRLPDAVANAEQRAHINQYFERVLGDRPTAKQARDAAAATIRRFPELIDLYIKLQEDNGDRAEAVSADKVEDTHRALVEHIRQALADVTARTDFFDKPWTSLGSASRTRPILQGLHRGQRRLPALQPRRQAVLQRKRSSSSRSAWCGAAPSSTSTARSITAAARSTSKRASAPVTSRLSSSSWPATALSNATWRSRSRSTRPPTARAPRSRSS
ncbi:MAG: hypothetical protein U0S48_18565 [Solirubrobacteraceae bacterium]